ncbi:hypothetical protein SISSUDRAFT_1066354 [Sistotremastrum suecicum HHB10207 ss-3]|uniref:DUF6535 domain-containing protein n=1 Tax=Sistotremastrum suecicum HHB10207 ss-3 TaxID=1314776 RepID=A0A165YEN1_9AGAM|nr:hypothetical protein SISSUDRAFT_1066354 [Sistotremastrum suecicum HHB10207 ss-3]
MSDQIFADGFKDLKETMREIKNTLIDHGNKFDILTKDAIKDEQPYDQRPCNDESTCTALYEMAMAKTKEEVEEWIKRMDVSLVFIALFSAVLTAFIIPATQNLFPSSINTPGNPGDTPPPLPSDSAQNVCVLFYLALIIAVSYIITYTALSIIHIETKVDIERHGNSYQERLFRHRAREELAKRWLKYLVEGLHIMLLSSIALFMTGLLYQLRNLGTSFEETAPRLLLIWQLGMALSSTILVVVAAATIHALFYEASPFGGPFSKLIIRLAEASQKSHILLPFIRGALVDAHRSLLRVKRRLVMNWATVIKVMKDVKNGAAHNIGPGFLGGIANMPTYLQSLLFLPLSLLLRWRVKVDWEAPQKLIGIYIDLITEASDSSLLERAVPSFSFSDWFDNVTEESKGKLLKACRRLMATDMSARVRQTISDRFNQFTKSAEQPSRNPIPDDILSFFASQSSLISDLPSRVSIASLRPNNGDLRPYSSRSLEQCIEGILCCYDWKRPAYPNIGERKDIFSFAHDHCCVLLSKGREAEHIRILSKVDSLSLTRSFRKAHDAFGAHVEWGLYQFFFRRRILSVSTTSDNTDLLPFASLPFEQAIANALCSYDRTTRPGNRGEIFEMAEFYCYGLLSAEKEDDLMRIISFVDRVSILRSYFQCPQSIFGEVVRFITGHCDLKGWRELHKFMKDAQYPTVRPSPVSHALACFPLNISLNCDLSHFLRYLSTHRYTKAWAPASAAAVSWLEAYSVSKVSDRPAIRQFLQCCVQTDLHDTWGRQCETSEETRHRAHSLLEGTYCSDSISVFVRSHQATELDRLSPQTEDIMSVSDSSSESQLYPKHSDPSPGLDFFSFPAASDDDIQAGDRAREVDPTAASAMLTPESGDHGPTLSAIAHTWEAAAIPLPPSRSHSSKALSSGSVFEASPRLENARTDQLL